MKTAWGYCCCDKCTIQTAYYLCVGVYLCSSLPLWLDWYHYLDWSLFSPGWDLDSSPAVRNSISIGSQVLGGCSSLLAAGLQATQWLRQSVTIYLKDFKLSRITVNTSAASLFHCHRLGGSDDGILVLFLRVILSLIYLSSSVQHMHHLLFCAWQSVVQVWSVACQMQHSDIYSQRTHIWTHSCAGDLRNMCDWCGRFTWEEAVTEHIVALRCRRSCQNMSSWKVQFQKSERYEG